MSGLKILRRKGKRHYYGGSESAAFCITLMSRIATSSLSNATLLQRRSSFARLEAGESKSIDLCRASWISAAIGKFAIRLSTLYFTRRGAQSQNINDVGAATRRNPMKSTILHGKYQRKHQRDAIRVSCTELSRDRNRREFALLTFVGECELLFDD